MKGFRSVSFKNEYGEEFVVHSNGITVMISGDEVNGMVDPARTYKGYLPLFNSHFNIWSDIELRKLGKALMDLHPARPMAIVITNEVRDIPNYKIKDLPIRRISRARAINALWNVGIEKVGQFVKALDKKDPIPGFGDTLRTEVLKAAEKVAQK